ncbi:MAG: family 1 glycosylhydrolase, partial [Verrucomicrobiales bacterium]
TWAAERLQTLREHQVEPIVGLLHHGSGPSDTSLVDPAFPQKMARYASKVVRQFPWIKYWTPVNEPVTTARFSGLYGHWYPHHRNVHSFALALYNEIEGTRLAMEEIRKVNPSAQLVQTEDMGKTYSTPLLEYQATFDNARRWLSFDMLFGWVDKHHDLWKFLIKAGLAEKDLLRLVDRPCPPDILGINHYVTSERFLDEKLENYPTRTHGGNGLHPYADLSAVRLVTPHVAGPSGILQEVWDRYKTTIAVTEAHLGCTREEQLRWIMEVYTAATKLKENGADIRAVTIWSMLGAFDWCSLLTRDDGVYEPGAFDVRSNPPRPTAIASLVRDLATTGETQMPLARNPGWWRRPVRFVYPAYNTQSGERGKPQADMEEPVSGPPLLITGATGTLGSAFARLCELRGLPYQVLTRQQFDITNAASVQRGLEKYQPWAVVNTAGYVRVDQAETEQERCFIENAQGPKTLAQYCAEFGIKLATFSSDLVFDGTKKSPYVESDPVCPLNTYGQSKADAEKVVLQLAPNSLVVRTSAFFGPWDRYNFLTVTLERLARGELAEVAADVVVSPTYVPDLVHATLDLLIDDEKGIWHLANEGSVSWTELAFLAAKRADLPLELICPRPLHKFHLPAPRPYYSVLSSERCQVMPKLSDAIERYFQERPLGSGLKGHCL